MTRLERDGLVSRLPDPADGRKFFAQLSEAGDAALQAASSTHNEVLRPQLLDRLRPAEQRTLGRIWQRVEPSET